MVENAKNTNMAGVRNVLRAEGKRVTAERRLLLRVIGNNLHLDANQIYLKANKQDRKIKLSTVYSGAKVFSGLSLVDTSDLCQGHDCYESNLKNYYNRICLVRGKVNEIPALLPLDKAGKEPSVDVVGRKVGLFGYCEDCPENTVASLSENYE